MPRRLYYIDWLRVLAVLLLFPFHTSRVFNFGEDFYIKSSELSVVLGYILGFISMWHMQLLFLLAGASAYFSLRRRTGRQFAGERLARLGVPFVFGLFVIMPPQTWVGAQFNSGYTGSFVQYITSGAFLKFDKFGPEGDYYGGFGIGHLWFIVVLLLISLIVLPLFTWGRRERGGIAMARFSRALGRPVWWLVPAVLIFIGEAFPDPTGLGIFYYLVFFVLGFVAVCDEAFMESAERHWRWALVVGMAGCAVWDASWRFRDSLADPSLALAGVNLLGALLTWIAIVGLLGAGRRWLDRPSPSLPYLAESSYPVYILHQTVIVVAAFYLLEVLPSILWIQWVVILAVAVVVTFALYEIVRRAGVLRFLFGMRPKPAPDAVAATPQVETPG